MSNPIENEAAKQLTNSEQQGGCVPPTWESVARNLVEAIERCAATSGESNKLSSWARLQSGLDDAISGFRVMCMQNA